MPVTKYTIKSKKAIGADRFLWQQFETTSAQLILYSLPPASAKVLMKASACFYGQGLYNRLKVLTTRSNCELTCARACQVHAACPVLKNVRSLSRHNIMLLCVKGWNSTTMLLINYKTQRQRFSSWIVETWYEAEHILRIMSHSCQNTICFVFCCTHNTRTHTILDTYCWQILFFLLCAYRYGVIHVFFCLFF